MIAAIARIVPLAVGMLLLSSCVAYQYRIVDPPEIATPLDRGEAFVFPWHPLEYQAVEAGDQLWLLIENPTDEPVLLQGERSYMVDPTGETHAPLRRRAIAPRSHITMALPPQPVYTPARSRVSVGFGVGTGYYGAAYGTGLYMHPWTGYPYWYWSAPDYMYFDGDGTFWRWRTGTVRMRLTYEQHGEQFIHDFTFERIRVKYQSN